MFYKVKNRTSKENIQVPRDADKEKEMYEIVPAQLEAIKKIQAWIRTRLFPVWSLNDVGTHISISRQKHVKLIENNSTSYNFCVRELAAYFMFNACFQHPITRRKLDVIEVKRIFKKLPPRLKICLKFTYEHAEQIQCSISQDNSIRDWLISEAGDILDKCILAIENDTMEDYAFYDFTKEYDHSLDEIFAKYPAFVDSTLKQHRLLVETRKGPYNSNPYFMRLETIILCKQYYTPCIADRARGAAAEWLLSHTAMR